MEASIAFICVPLRDERFMMTHQLRALTLLDNSIRKVSPDNYILSSTTNIFYRKYLPTNEKADLAFGKHLLV